MAKTEVAKVAEEKSEMARNERSASLWQNATMFVDFLVSRGKVKAFIRRGVGFLGDVFATSRTNTSYLIIRLASHLDNVPARHVSDSSL